MPHYAARAARAPVTARRMPTFAVADDPQAVFHSEGELLLYVQIRDAGLEMPTHYGTAQFHIHVGGKQPFRPDFTWEPYGFSVEVMGYTWSKHYGATIPDDYRRHNAIALTGWRVLYVTTDMVMKTHEALDWVRRALALAQRGAW